MPLSVKHLSAARKTSAVLGAALMLVVAGCSSDDAKRYEATGEITEAAEADVFSIAVGDCLDMSGQSDAESEIGALPTVPCSDPHDSEVYAEMTFSQVDYPADELTTSLDEFCYNEFSPFVGMAYEESVLLVTTLYPTPTSWDEGDRVGQCIVMHPDELVTSTLQGAAI